jgi:hypothetical protein
MSTLERNDLDAYLNFDAAAGDLTPLGIGPRLLLERAETIAAAGDIEFQTAPASNQGRSDHAAFLEEGLPAIMLTNPDFDRGHTPDDTFDLLETGSILPLARIGFGLLQDLS